MGYAVGTAGGDVVILGKVRARFDAPPRELRPFVRLLVSALALQGLADKKCAGWLGRWGTVSLPAMTKPLKTPGNY